MPRRTIAGTALVAVKRSEVRILKVDATSAWRRATHELQSNDPRSGY